MKINDQRIVLTGAASGIGRALLRRLAAYPVSILAVDINGDCLAQSVQAASQIESNRIPRAVITSLVCDLSASELAVDSGLPVRFELPVGFEPPVRSVRSELHEPLDRLFERALAALGGIDLFIANAGFAYYEQITQADWVHIEKIFRLNVFVPLYCLEKMQMLNGERPYKMVITASAMAHIGVPGYALYSATKAALHRFADVYRWQLRDPRRLLLVYPIATRTGFFTAAGEGVPTPWPSQSPETVAAAILRAIEHDQLESYPSRLFQLIRFLDPLLPMRRLVQWLEYRRLRRWLHL